jgi:Fe2+ transport system protein FeoA
MEIFKVKNIFNNRLSEMGLIKGTIFRIVKRVAGMIQIKLKGSDIVIREEMMKDIDYD